MATQSAAMIKTASEIRREFFEFFQEKHGHVYVPSSPVVPHGDPTLLFTNAGMNQFKDIFLGRGDRQYTRVVNTQKCIRAGGKHNDLEDVGKDLFHHTFFEMLGNWSFGDYFKAEAIDWAWDLLVNVWRLEPDRLYATVFAGEPTEGTEPDLEAEELWKRFLPPDHISRWGKKDNFWEMGETGPCGPCSEIHYDSRPPDDRRALPGDQLVNQANPHVIEIWNLVFIQFNRAPASDGRPGQLTPLPARHVDTGMGFERVVRIIQGKQSNYDIDLWQPIFNAIKQHTGAHHYQGALDDPIDVAYRVVADHVRCLTVAINDGAMPGNEGRGYVLRRILRRAVRHAHQTLAVQGPVLCHLVPAVVQSLADVFPELNDKPDRIAQIIRDEEESFLRTVDRGIALFDLACANAVGREYAGLLGPDVIYAGAQPVAFWEGQMSERQAVREASEGLNFVDRLSGEHRSVSTAQAMTDLQAKGNWPVCIGAEDAFKLHDTYGFPIDLTRVMAEERGMTVDEDGYEKLMEQARRISRRHAVSESELELPPDAIAKLEHMGVRKTQDHYKYDPKPLTALVKAIWDGATFDDRAHLGSTVAVILDRTNHYAEAGGQLGDKGTIFTDVLDPGSAPARGYGGREESGACRFKIHDTREFGDYILHIGRVVEGKLRVGEKVNIHVDPDHRRPTLANHTGTHLLNHALRQVLGDEINQRGSLVAPDRLRFDFSCTHAMSAAQIETVEALVNNAIEDALPVCHDMAPLDQAMRIHGLRAVFGERYPDPVRVVSIGKPVADLLDDPANTDWYRYSIELCGGTHLASTDETGALVIVHEQALAAGVRRILALTGPAARAAVITGRELEARLRDAANLPDDTLLEKFDALAEQFEHLTMSSTAKHRLTPLIDALRRRVRTLRKNAFTTARGSVVDQARRIADECDEQIIVRLIVGADRDTLLPAMDVIRAKRPDSAAMLFAPDEQAGKVAIAAAVPDDLIRRGLKAGDWVRQAARLCDGGGGGRPDLAQAGGKNPANVAQAMAAARSFAQDALQI